MITEYRFELEQYRGIQTRYHCPSCNARTFVRYIDRHDGSYIHDSVGRCNRQVKCAHHYPPMLYFKDNKISANQRKAACRPVQRPNIQPSFIPAETWLSTLNTYEANCFVSFLINLFGQDIAERLVARYFIGTSDHWQGSTIFWQIDTQGRIRTGKIMLYNEVTGKRVKNPFSHITWVHSVYQQPDFQLNQCLFGEHLLTGNALPVAIVESEKTAIISSIYLPQFIWVAVGGLSNLNIEKFKILKGRTVILFPDIKGFDAWNKKAKELGPQMPGTRFEISDLLETSGSETERDHGFDIADYLIRLDWRQFQKNITDRR